MSFGCAAEAASVLIVRVWDWRRSLQLYHHVACFARDPNCRDDARADAGGRVVGIFLTL